MAISYNNIDVGDGNFKLSPSGLTLFYRNPREWLNNLEGNIVFKGNTSTILGTCVHYIFESHFDGRTEKRYWEDVREYLMKEINLEVINEFQSKEILGQLAIMYPEVIKWIENDDAGITTTNSEAVVKYKLPKEIIGNVDNQYYIAGSIDAIIYDETAKSENQFGIRDYKTSKRKVSSIDNYIHQLMTYAVAWNATQGENAQVGFVEVVNIYNNKSGVQFNVIRKYLTDDLVDGINAIFTEVVLTHKTIEKYPQLRDIVFRDGVDFMGRLKPLGEKDE